MNKELEPVRLTEILTGPSEHALAVELGRMSRRGEMAAASEIKEIRGGYAVKVIRIAEPRPRIRRRRWAGLGAGLLILVALLWVLVQLVTALAAALAALAPYALLLFAIVAAVSALGAPATIEVVQRVTIKR